MLKFFFFTPDTYVPFKAAPPLSSIRFCVGNKHSRNPRKLYACPVAEYLFFKKVKFAQWFTAFCALATNHLHNKHL